jgi:hypothetical protein
MPESPLLFSFVVPACGFCLQVQSRSRGVKGSRSGRPRADRDRRARAAVRKVAEGSPTSRLLNFSTVKSREQSENVYENKGQVQEVAESYSARPNADRNSSGAQAGRRRLSPRLLDSSTCQSQNRGNKPRMSMKTKDKVNKSRNPSPGSLLSPPSPHGRGLFDRVRLLQPSRANRKREKIQK